MQYFDSAEVQAKLSAANSTIPAATEALKNEEVANNPDVIAFGEQFAVGVPFPNTPYMDCLWGPAADTTVAIWSGAQTPEEALEAFKTTMDESSCMVERREQIEALATPAQ
jgi:maltose-binding protein MalE